MTNREANYFHELNDTDDLLDEIWIVLEHAKERLGGYKADHITKELHEIQNRILKVRSNLIMNEIEKLVPEIVIENR